ncbi:DUF222 domain-containing protein [Microbacterium sp. X-17]|uniref:HNH endonuclease n=1 Tax=Microbacterium sp. X-17 TaxID=3144404 RepID=UPI0031F543F1
MDELLASLAAAVDAVRAAGGGRAPEALGPGELMAVNEAFGALRRRVDAAYLPVATEITRQSRTELGKDSLARKQGFRSPAMLISATTGATVGDAVRMVTVGEATAPRTTLTGQSAPAKHPHVAAALSAGEIGMPAASAIISMLDRVAIRADRAAADRMEKTLAAAAPGLTLDQLHKLIARAEAHLDPDGLAPREEQLHADRFLTVREDRGGAILVTGAFDPENGAPIKAAIEGLVTGMIRRRDDTAGPVAEDTRSVRQMQADALADLCRHALGCAEVPTGPSTTVVVRMSLSDLEAGTGAGEIDGIAQPVSAAVVRRMAADAQIIPCVLGGESEILDWGRAKRLFTPAQKLALVERDGGCAFCGAPPHMTVVHHLRWWARDAGRTDLGNGILLCVACHHRIHNDGWDIRIDGTGSGARVWFIPPPWLDPARTPRLGGRTRYDLAA